VVFFLMLLFAKRYRHERIDPDVLASAAAAGVIRVPQDVSRVEAAIQYARAAATAAEEGVGGDMGGDPEGDPEGDMFSMTIELDGAHRHEIEPRYETYARINFPGVVLRGTEPGTVLCGGGIRVTSSAATVTVENLRVADPARAGTWNKTDAHGLLVDGGAKCHVLQCTFEACGGSGVCGRGAGSSATLVGVASTAPARAGCYAIDGGSIEMREGSRADHNVGCGVEARGRSSRITIHGDTGQVTSVTRTIDRRSRFATRTRVLRDTATSFQNGERNVREEDGGRVVFMGDREEGSAEGSEDVVR
jgi:hypothetical protein